MKAFTTMRENAVIELSIIVGEQMSAVTFVQDYLQLDFDGVVLTLFVWPKLVSDAGTWELGTPGYRDQLCAMIGCKVSGANAYKHDRIQIEFVEGSSIVVPIDPQSRMGKECAILKDGSSERWEYW